MLRVASRNKTREGLKGAGRIGGGKGENDHHLL